MPRLFVSLRNWVLSELPLSTASLGGCSYSNSKHELTKKKLSKGEATIVSAKHRAAHYRPRCVATPPSHTRMQGTRKTLVQNIPDTESANEATDSARPNTPVATPLP